MPHFTYISKIIVMLKLLLFVSIRVMVSRIYYWNLLKGCWCQ